MSKLLHFDDGSRMEWIDRETLRYVDGNLAVAIWTDFEPGIFSSGRVVRESEIKRWSTSPEDSGSALDEATRARVIEKVQQYYRHHGRKCRIVP